MNKTHYDYDEFLNIIQQQPINVPSDLGEHIQSTIKSLPFMKRHLIYIGTHIASYMVLFLLTTTLLIYFNKDIAAIAAEIPGLSRIVDWVGDRGTENALENGYPEIAELVFVQGDYKLILNHIMIDEERISFNALLVGDDLKYKPLEDMNSDQLATGSLNRYHYEFSLANSAYNGYVVTPTRFQRKDGELACQVTVQLENLNVKQFIADLSSENQPIKMVCILTDFRDINDIIVLETFNIDIPLAEQSVLLSKYIKVDKTILFDEGSIHFYKMVISPTRMRLIAAYYNVGDSYAVTLDNYWLEDDQGNRYEMEVSGLMAGSSFSSSDVCYNFVPSSYFDSDFEALTLNYESYSFKKVIEPITLSSSMLPHTIHYGGYEVTVTEMVYEQGTLQLKISYPNDPAFLFQGFQLVGGIGPSTINGSGYQEGNKDTFAVSDIVFYNVSEQENYTFTMGYTMIIKEQAGQLELLTH